LYVSEIGWFICKLRSGVNWQGALKQKGVKQTGVQQGLGVCGNAVEGNNCLNQDRFQNVIAGHSKGQEVSCGPPSPLL
jgi:hypothetical protein